MLAAVAGVVLMGQGRNRQNLVVRSLTIEDDDGVAHVALGVKGSVPFITIRDKAGKNRLSIDQRGLTIKDAKGKTRAELRTANQGAPFLGLFDEAGVARASLFTLPNGAPILNLRDKAGQTMALLTTVRGGACSLYLTEAGVLRAELGVGSLALHDAKGNVVWQAPPK